MVRRFERKSRKYRGGLRTHSWGGRVGQHRKSGSSGGRGGKSGLHKHKWSLVMKYAEDTNGYPFFGKHGFKQPNTIVAAKLGINVGELEMMLDELVSKGLAQVPMVSTSLTSRSSVLTSYWVGGASLNL